MISSVFIRDVLDSLLDGDEEALQLRKQVPFITESDYEYTGSGVFVGFHKDPGIEAFKLPVGKAETMAFHGVTVKSPQLEKDGAAVILHVKNGIINYLEIWAFGGDYPKKELTNYQLIQTFRDQPPANLPNHKFSAWPRAPLTWHGAVPTSDT